MDLDGSRPSLFLICLLACIRMALLYWILKIIVSEMQELIVTDLAPVDDAGVLPLSA